jgi:hypothetical protein
MLRFQFVPLRAGQEGVHMQDAQVKEEYVAPTLEKCQQLKDVTEGAAVGGTTTGSATSQPVGT